MFLFKNTVFNNASRSSDCVDLNDSVINEVLTVKDVKRMYRRIRCEPDEERISGGTELGTQVKTGSRAGRTLT